ncbi:EamA family transporter RarD [Tabrizicola oligotrophica]|uniref:EamA family transporter RarD n=1 Tax=Tabrizicola oligotrophica TaxID=2710650 RepID=A0A6M0QRY0_9RHOB|nr:EamA family transporter RarD [Tabrizicola oligotrophica]NEY89192.1 EamA family transporter RarD [Tabrizicola oligotrophica]
MSEAAKGVAAIVAACLIWGFATLYYKAMAHVPPLEVLSHRLLWTLIFFGALLGVQGRLGQVWRLILGPRGLRVALAGAVIALNWGIFIWAIQAGHAVEASLGYYILPLVSVVMGVVLLGERLTRAQGLAVALAALAVLVLTYGMGVAPWIALVLAFSFAPYLVLKKEMTAPAMVSVTAEVLVIAPLAVIWLLGAHVAGWLEFGRAGGLWGRELYTTLMLPVTGLISGLPLILLSWGAQRVRLSTLGVVQYLNPTLQAFSAVVVMGEPFSRWHAAAFGLIWAALAVYSLAAILQDRAARRAACSAATSATGENSPSIEASAKP